MGIFFLWASIFVPIWARLGNFLCTYSKVDHSIFELERRLAYQKASIFLTEFKNLDFKSLNHVPPYI